MEKFFRKNTEAFLAGIAVLVIGIMSWLFIWSMVYVSQNLDSVFESMSAPTPTVSFNISGAQGLNLKGLVPQK